MRAGLGRRLAPNLRAILTNEIYAKVLRKRMSHRSESPSSSLGHEADNVSDGHILNLVSADIDKISFIGGSLYLAWVSFPVQITVAIFLLYRVLGISGIIGVGMMMALLPLNGMISKRMMAVQREVLTASDARIQCSTEVLSNIRTIRVCGLGACLPGKGPPFTRHRVETASVTLHLVVDQPDRLPRSPFYCDHSDLSRLHGHIWQRPWQLNCIPCTGHVRGDTHSLRIVCQPRSPMSCKLTCRFFESTGSCMRRRRGSISKPIVPEVLSDSMMPLSNGQLLKHQL